jgi:hypothetical protein
LNVRDALSYLDQVKVSFLLVFEAAFRQGGASMVEKWAPTE